jgi:hypothetical protein
VLGEALRTSYFVPMADESGVRSDVTRLLDAATAGHRQAVADLLSLVSIVA